MKKTKLIVKRSAIKKLAHKKGFKPSADFFKALDEMIEIQINRACEHANKNKKKVLKRNMIFSLFS